MKMMHYEFDIEEETYCDCKACKMKETVQRWLISALVAQAIIPLLWPVSIGAVSYVYWQHTLPTQVRDFIQHDNNKRYIRTVLYYDITGFIIYMLMAFAFAMYICKILDPPVNI